MNCFRRSTHNFQNFIMGFWSRTYYRECSFWFLAAIPGISNSQTVSFIKHINKCTHNYGAYVCNLLGNILDL